MIHTNRLTRSRVITPEEIAQQEADAIRALPSDPFAAMLRLHVVGDATTARAAETIARAAEDWRARCNDAPPYGYTHAWRTVPRAAWRSVSMLASVEDEAGALAAIARDYAPAIVVPNFTSARASITPAGLRVVPCPAITRGKTCDECRLCFDDRALLERRAVIAFEAHGARARSVRAALVQPC